MEDKRERIIASFERNCGACGHHCSELSALIAKGLAKPEDCVMYSDEVELFSQGEYVPLAPFIRDMIRNIVTGIAASLKGIDPEGEIEIVVRPKRQDAEEEKK